MVCGCNLFGSSKSEGEQSSPTESVKDGRRFSLNMDKLVGLIALVVGVGLVGISTVLASGLYGGGAMFFVAAAVVFSSLIPFCVGAYLLMNPAQKKSPMVAE